MKITSTQVTALVLLSAATVLGQTDSAGQPAATVAPTAGRAETEGHIQSYLDSLAAENKLSGAIVVAKDGVPIASKASGVANKTTSAPITLDTKFNLGSMDKMFTGIAITQLAQRGKLNFNDPISKYLPDYPNKDIGTKVTIHQLLTHTSGMGSYVNDKFRAQRTKLTTIAAHFPLFVDDPLSFSPGEKFEYSNSGYMVLGAIIERVSG